MSRMTGGYELGRRHDACAATGDPLRVGDSYVAVLYEDPESDELGRLDYSVQAWEGGARPELPRRIYAYWRGTVPEPNRKPGLAIDESSIMSVFEQLDAPEDPKRLALRYVLALMLMRKKKLVLVGQEKRPDGSSVTLLRERGEPDDAAPIEVVDPELDESTLADVAEQLEGIMHLGDA